MATNKAVQEANECSAFLSVLADSYYLYTTCRKEHKK
jgi:hypothetical protein